MKIKTNYISAVILTGILATVSPLVVLAQLSPKANLDSATACYTSGRFADALGYYDQVLINGKESYELYFNMGNTAFRLNELAQAVWFYEKALRLKPGDEDATFNLGLINSRITDKIDQVPLLFYERWWRSFVNLFPPDTWSMVSLILLSLTGASLLLFFQAGYMWQRKTGFWLSLTFGVLLVFSISFAWKGTQRIMNHNEAIIFATTVTAKSSPDASAVDLFVLHEGTKVGINDQIGEWLRIKIANGSVGWIKEKSLKRL
ncbi:MAG: hypothetical protein CVU06_12820 [Bacteroidetes bacterium HGW-Bacteroidetes-22]|nr:MAG: hypothetical protein CVU06_12820 [Bacteroidetes bacterium HGW-Bacteroidetes-22]